MESSKALSPFDLRTALLGSREMAMEGGETDPKYGWYNGLWFAVQRLGAREAGRSPGPGRSTVAAHFDHVRETLVYMRHVLAGEEYHADWGASWKIAAPSEAEWEGIRLGFRHEYQVLREAIENKVSWSAAGFSIAINNIAHTAYHAGAVRQILKSA